MGGEHHDVWIPFTAKQVKSAIGNVGTYDDSDDFMLAEDELTGPEVDKLLERPEDPKNKQKFGERIARRFRVLQRIEQRAPKDDEGRPTESAMRIQELEDQIFNAIEQYRDVYGEDALDEFRARLQRDEDLDIGEFLLNEVDFKKQTDTPAFKRWFKDSKVSRKGEPLRVYHATGADNDFDTFTQSMDIGFHFGTKEAANHRAQTIADDSEDPVRVMPAYLSIQNPIRLPDLEMFDPEDVFAATSFEKYLYRLG